MKLLARFMFFLLAIVALSLTVSSMIVGAAGGRITGAGLTLYWTETKTGAVLRGNANGNGPPEVLVTGQANPRGLVVSDSRETIYWIERDAGRIWSANLDGSGLKILVGGLSSPDRMALDDDAGTLYFTENGDSDRVRRVNVDGSGLQTIQDGLAGPTGIALGSDSHGDLYWTEYDSDSIWAYWYEWGRIPIVQLAAGARPLEIVRDGSQSRLYWTSGAQGVIYSFAPGDADAAVWMDLGSPRALAIDVVARKLYWSDFETKLIQRSNLDGTGVETLFSAGDGIDAPLGLGLSTLAPTACYFLGYGSVGEGSLPTLSPTNSSGCVTGEYVAGQLITLTASPAAGWRVAGWSGTSSDGSTSLINTVIMPAADHNVMVYYELVPDCHQLTLGHEGEGANPGAQPLQSVGCNYGMYTKDEAILLEAAPARNWAVAGWSGTVWDESNGLTNFVVMPDSDHHALVRYRRASAAYVPQIISQLASGPTCFVGPDEIEPNSRPLGEPNGPLCSGKEYYGRPNDADDHFTFQTSGGSIDIAIKNHKGGGVQVVLYYATLNSRPIFIDNDTSNGLLVSLRGQPAGLYYIQIYTAAPNPNEMQKYQLTVRFQ